jgi:hypothetical protein
VRFLAEREGTRVELEHRSWEQHGGEAAETRESYVHGWPTVLRRYEKAAVAGSISR